MWNYRRQYGEGKDKGGGERGMRVWEKWNFRRQYGKGEVKDGEKGNWGSISRIGKRDFVYYRIG